ncbi:MAG: SdrD B-like domain-containing protein, partial [Planctomycetota bacterium]
MIQSQQSGTFYDYYDNLLAAGSQVGGATIDLRADNDDGQADRSAATIFAFNLTPKPVTLKGSVFTDPSIGCGPQGSLVGIGGVELNLERLNTLTQKYEWVAKTSTNATGAYEFGESLGLVPGTYRIVQAQPQDFLDVSAKAGTVNGTTSGSVDVDSSGNKNIITGVNIPLGGIAATGYDFLEVRPIALSGRVWHDRNDNGKLDLGEEGIANVSIRVTRTGTGDSSRPDPFLSQNFPIVVKTAADGTYSVEGLPPGLYEIVEVSNYPPGANPLAGFIDGQDSLGMVDGQPSGISGNDQFTQIKVCAGESGAEFNFGELKPVSIGGYVGLATPEGDCLRFGQPGFQGISGVTIQLYDFAGTLVRTTQTDASGKYEFAGLKNGVYSVVEVQPNGYLDGGEMLGVVAGQANGSKTENDRFTGITLTSGQAGVNYDFCEHLPAKICGLVWHDRNDNGSIDSGEEPIGNVLVELFDKQGNRVSQTYTDVLGKYCFENLYAGEYCVKETQPAGYRDGKDSL